MPHPSRFILFITLLTFACSDPPKEEPATTPEKTPAKADVSAKATDTAKANEGPAVVGEPAAEDQKAAGQRSLVNAYLGASPSGWQDASALPKSPVFKPESDTSALPFTLRYLNEGELPPPEHVRPEAFINAFTYDYGATGAALTLNYEAVPNPFGDTTFVVLGLQGRKGADTPSNPVHLILLVDDSPSMRSPERLTLITRVLQDITQQLNPDDRITLATYGGHAQLILGPTPGDDLRSLRYGFDLLRDDNRSTAGSLPDGDGMRIAESQIIPDNKDIAQHVVILSDGDPRVSGSTADEAVTAAQALYDKGVSVHAVTVGTGDLKAPEMERITLKGGGIHTYAQDIDDLTKPLLERLEIPLNYIGRDFTASVEWNPAAVKRYRLIGFEKSGDLDNTTHGRSSYLPDHQATAIYEIETVPGSKDNLGKLILSAKAMGSADQQDIPYDLVRAGIRSKFENGAPRVQFAVLAAILGEFLARKPEAATRDIKALTAAITPLAPQIPRGETLLEILELVGALDTEKQTALGIAEPEVVAAKTPKKRKDDGPKEPVVHGSKEDIAKVFDTKKKDIEGCYKRILMKSAAAGGTIGVEVTVSSTGRVSRVNVGVDQIGNGMGNCVKAKIKNWRFPAVGEVVKVNKKWRF